MYREIYLEYCHLVPYPQQSSQDINLRILWENNLDTSKKILRNAHNSNIRWLSSRYPSDLKRDPHTAPLLFLNENLDESNHVLGLLQTIESVQTNQLLKDHRQSVKELASKIVANKHLWHDVINDAQQDPAVVVYLLKLLSALVVVPKGSEPMVPTPDVVALLDELLEAFKQHPNEVEQFLTRQLPSVEMALRLLFP